MTQPTQQQPTIWVGNHEYEIHVYRLNTEGHKVPLPVNFNLEQIKNIQGLAQEILSPDATSRLTGPIQLVNSRGIQANNQFSAHSNPAAWQSFEQAVLDVVRQTSQGQGANGVAVNPASQLKKSCSDLTAPEIALLEIATINDLDKVEPEHVKKLKENRPAAYIRALKSVRDGYAPNRGLYNAIKEQIFSEEMHQKMLKDKESQEKINLRKTRLYNDEINSLNSWFHQIRPSSTTLCSTKSAVNELYTTFYNRKDSTISKELHKKAVKLVKKLDTGKEHLIDYYKKVATARNVNLDDIPFSSSNKFIKYWSTRTHYDGDTAKPLPYQTEFSCLVEALAHFVDTDAAQIDPTKPATCPAGLLKKINPFGSHT